MKIVTVMLSAWQLLRVSKRLPCNLWECAAPKVEVIHLKAQLLPGHATLDSRVRLQFTELDPEDEEALHHATIISAE